MVEVLWLKVSKSFKITVNDELCKSCGICYWVCPTHAIVKGKLNAPKIADQTLCIGCKQCERLCPDFAIDISEVEGVKEDD